jgi:RNA polymerase sigma-70 factor (ECF subfamily)
MQASQSDIDLMQRLVQRDQTALAALYQLYGSLVYSLALRVLQDASLAEEITQDAFLEVWNRPESWDPAKGRLSSWLLTLTRYTAIDRLRRERRQLDAVSHPLDDGLEQLPSTEEHAGDPRWQEGQTLRLLMAQLPPEQAQVIELAFFQGMTHSEMAQYTQLPLGTIKTRVRLGLQKLKSLWEETGNHTSD